MGDAFMIAGASDGSRSVCSCGDLVAAFMIAGAVGT